MDDTSSAHSKTSKSQKWRPQSRSLKRSRRCVYCRRRGHHVTVCWRLHPHSAPYCTFCHIKGHSSNKCWYGSPSYGKNNSVRETRYCPHHNTRSHDAKSCKVLNDPSWEGKALNHPTGADKVLQALSCANGVLP